MGAGGDRSTDYDLIQVWISTDGGATFSQLGQLNPTFTTSQPDYAPFSSGGPAAAPVWRHYASAPSAP